MHKLSFAVLIGVLIAAPTAAQEQRGSIEGVVKDASNLVLPGATLEAKSPALVGVQTTVSDVAGHYRFPALAPGKYEITATLQGFRPAVVRDVTLALGQILKVDLTLALEGVTEMVQVRGDAVLIDVRQNATSTSITPDVIDRIPKGRDFTNLVAFQAPGANQESRAGGIQIDGASGSENRFVIDGMDSTDLRSGTSRTSLLTDFVQEIQVKSSGYNAEYRASTGGVVSAITKSGSNTFGGLVGAYFNSDKLQGAQRKLLRLSLTNQDVAEQYNVPDDIFRRWEPVASLGGPVLKDRAWFFAGFIPQVQHTVRTVTFQSNQIKQTFVQDTKDLNLNYNVTTQALRSLRVRFSGSNQRGTGASAFPAIEPDGTSRSTYANFQGDRVHTDSFGNSYAGVIDWVASGKLYLNVTTGYLTYGTHSVGPVGTKLRHSFSASNTCATGAIPGSGACPFPEIPAGLQQVSGYVDDISSSLNYGDNYGRLTLNSDATFYANWFGRHTLKGGIQFERLSNNVNSGAAYPTMSLFWNSSRATLSGQSVRGKYGYYTVTRGVVTLGDIAFTNTGLFLQDGWTVNDRLTLNLGVRTEREDVPSYRAENPGIHFSMKDKIAPRIGFAYDLRGNGRWKLYGSWGVFYDLMKLSLSRILFGADRWVDYYYTMDSYDWPAIQCGYPPVSGPTCPGTFIEQADYRHVSNEAGASSLVDPGLKPMKTQEFTLGVDHELAKSVSVGIRYSHKWLNRTIEAFGVLVPNVGEIYRVANPGYGWDTSPLTDPFISPGLVCPNCPGQPPAKRIYDGVEVRLRKRFADRWAVTASYTMSRIFGNYAGLANSDENGRTDPNSSRNFDQLTMYYDHNGQVVEGRLQTDRPQVFKAEGSYDFKWGTSVGLDYTRQSGTPLQTQMNHLSAIFFFPYGRGDLGRTPTFSQTNLLVQHTFKMFKGPTLNVNVNVTNLFDQGTWTSLSTSPYRDNINLSFTDFFKGFDPVAYAAVPSNNVRKDARFMTPSAYQSRRVIRINASIRF